MKTSRNALQKQASTPPITIKTTPDAIATQKSVIGDEVSDVVVGSPFVDWSAGVGVPTGCREVGAFGHSLSFRQRECEREYHRFGTTLRQPLSRWLFSSPQQLR